MGPALKSSFCAPVGSENNHVMARLFHLLYRERHVSAGIFVPVFFRAAREEKPVPAVPPRMDRHRTDRCFIPRTPALSAL